MIKGSINQEDITILNTCAPNNRAPESEAGTGRSERRNRQIHNYNKKSNTPLSVVDRISTQKNQYEYRRHGQQHQIT